VRLGNCIDECQSETVTGGVFSLHKPFENLAANIGRETRTVVFNHKNY
jgi:hypothetical protein